MVSIRKFEKRHFNMLRLSGFNHCRAFIVSGRNHFDLNQPHMRPCLIYDLDSFNDNFSLDDISFYFIFCDLLKILNKEEDLNICKSIYRIFKTND